MTTRKLEDVLVDVGLVAFLAIAIGAVVYTLISVVR